jgi:hypothetical protein
MDGVTLEQFEELRKKLKEPIPSEITNEEDYKFYSLLHCFSNRLSLPDRSNILHILRDYIIKYKDHSLIHFNQLHLIHLDINSKINTAYDALDFYILYKLGYHADFIKDKLIDFFTNNKISVHINWADDFMEMFKEFEEYLMYDICDSSFKITIEI